MAKTFEGWDVDEWDRVVARLRVFDVTTLLALAQICGITFAHEDRMTAEDVILVLDEADPEALYRNLADLEQDRS